MNAQEFLKQFQWDDFDSQLLLAHILRRSRTWLLAHLETPLSPLEVDSANQAFAKLQAGVPLPYILGHWQFFGLELNLTDAVLIPRPETELLVENAIRWLNSHPEARSVADVGTGSGAIAISIAVNIPDVKILATDISSAALKVAKANAQKNKVANQIEFVEYDLLPPAKINLVCANLPYIPTETLRGLPIYQNEPTLALDGGADGLDVYRKLFSRAPAFLAPNYLMLCEIEATHGQKALELAKEHFPNSKVTLRSDLAGHDRLIEINNEN
ncbi:MAG: peptide chain release factor N(5)-glutamine methyltransferase [Anaerolineales bacterium]|nr:peptide chain release factor N(5)-glutamine methyltransferase [Anaerolineales bacterium]MCZ2122408.1 peptide chain release factor N(5)-glutamine methyltransferase [Anaerolineales bacterium]